MRNVGTLVILSEKVDREKVYQTQSQRTLGGGHKGISGMNVLVMLVQFFDQF